MDGPFVDDVGMFKPHLATFKDADAIKGYIKSVVAKVETILKNHKQSGHHSSGEERLQEIKNNFLNAKGKNVDLSYFYALKFTSRQLDDGIGASAGFGTVGGGATAARKKCNVQEVVALDIQNLTKKIAENADGICVDTQNTITRLFSPSPIFHLHLVMLVTLLVPVCFLTVLLSAVAIAVQKMIRLLWNGSFFA
jgi:hypothetical protein